MSIGRRLGVVGGAALLLVSLLLSSAASAAPVTRARSHALNAQNWMPIGATASRSAHSVTPSVSANVQYYGGPIVSNPDVAGVFWGTGTFAAGAAPTSDNMPAFYTAVGNSDWFHSLTEYNTNITNGTDQIIGTAHADSSPDAQITPPTGDDGTTITDTEMRDGLAAAITAGTVPAPTVDNHGYDNTVYALYFPAGKTLRDINGNVGGVAWCAYHGTLDYSGLQIPYMVLPAYTVGSNYATGSCGTNSTAFEDFTQVTSHELAEATTDPAVEDATSFAAPVGWYDISNGEVADICVGHGVTIATYAVQEVWSQAANSCVAYRTFLNLTPAFATIEPGGSQAYVATGNSAADDTSATTFAITGPAGASCTGHTCTATSIGNYKVHGTDGALGSDYVDLTVAAQDAGPPTAVTATAGNASADVSWTAPVDNGGSTITTYIATSSPGGLFCASSTTGCTVTGLTNGTSYTFTVTATNGVGTGSASSPSNAVTPATYADPPTSVTASRGNGSADVSWTAPVNNGGSTVTGYTATSAPGGQTCSTATTGCTVTGLTNGTSYTFSVTTTNGVGTGSASSPSNAVTPATYADPPTSVSAIAGSGSAAVSWTPPLNDGGSTVTGYTATSAPGGRTCSTATTGCTVTGLTNGTQYTFTVTATNGVGTGSASSPSNAVTPVTGATVPSAPLAVKVTPHSGSLTVSWSAPHSTGGAPITSYVATARNGATTTHCTTTTLSCTISGLSKFAAYTVQVSARNTVGSGPVANFTLTVFADGATKLSLAVAPAVAAGKSLTMAAFGARPGTVTFTVGAVTKKCTANALGQCTVSATFSAAGATVVKAAQGAVSATAKVYAVTFVVPASAVHGSTFLWKVASGRPGAKVVLSTSDGRTIAGTISVKGVAALAVKAKAKGNLTIVCTVDGVVVTTKVVRVT